MAVERVLVAFAHPDDAEFSLGGAAAAWADQGVEVTYVCVTDGSAGSNAPGAMREEIAKVREEEMSAAAKILGVADIAFLGYTDGEVEVTLGLRRDLTRQVRRVRPDIVVSPDPSRLWSDRSASGRTDYINHRDHRMVGEAMLAVTSPDAPTRPQFPELLDEGYEPFEIPALWLPVWDRSEADTFVDITSTIERKIEALRAHASQMQDWPIEDFVREQAREVAEGRDEEYAEAFRTFRLTHAAEEAAGPAASESPPELEAGA